jgi:O-glycosyl hydrolase
MEESSPSPSQANRSQSASTLNQKKNANCKYQVTACVCKEITGDSGRGKELAGTNKKGYR